MRTPDERTKGKHVPMRRCVVCRASRPQGELERFTQLEGTWQHDPKRRVGGRGAWVCADNGACHKTKALGRAFRAQAETVSDILQSHRTSQGAEREASAARTHNVTNTPTHPTQNPTQ